MADKPVVGFVGVGLMGWGMARNVVEKGWPLRVIAHRRREAVEDLVGRGAVEVGSLAEMGESCEIVVLCVTGAPQVEEAVAGVTGDGAAVKAIIDATTSDPDVTRRLAAELRGRGIEMIDAPLSRTPAHTWEGEATTYVGGSAEQIERHRELLSAWASAIIPVNGPVGAAHAVKLVNNAVAIGYAAIWSEAYAMMRKIGVEPAVLREVITHSGMNCGNFQNYSKYPCEGVPDAHKFALANCLKDISYYTRLADGHGACTLASSGALQALKLGATMGMGERMVPQMGDIFLRLNGDEPAS